MQLLMAPSDTFLSPAPISLRAGPSGSVRLVWLQLLGRLLRYSDELRYWLSKPTVCGGAQSSWDIVHFSLAHI